MEVYDYDASDDLEPALNSYPCSWSFYQCWFDVPFVFTSLHQALADISKGDMQEADDLEEGDDDLHLSDEEDDDADKMSLASDLDDEDLEDVEQRQKELEKKAPKKKLVAVKSTKSHLLKDESF